MIDGRALWYLTRGTGLVALLLLTASVVFGILDTTRWTTPRWPRTVVAGLHRHVSLLVVAFIAVHVVAAIADAYAPIRWLDAIVPFGSRYRPVWLGLGALAFDLVIALVLTSVFRRRLGAFAWRLVHWLAYACWPLALVHSIGTGSDVRLGWLDGVCVICVAAVLVSVGYRLTRPGINIGVSLAGGASVAAALVTVCLWTFSGPLQDGWAQHAGTPVALLAHRPRVVVRAVSSLAARPARRLGATLSSTSSSAPLKIPFAARFTGEKSTLRSGTSVQLAFDGVLADSVRGRFHLTVIGTEVGTGLRITYSAVSLGTAARPKEFQGVVIGLKGTQVDTAVYDSSGHMVQLLLRLQLHPDTTISGVAQARFVS